ncbi:hypothetical protein MM213_08100 [Belliella sp. R4-6]|uniref:Uncharacterized protein n=1 Tax=Belliella alkalica TaxID=1730871 RepID=A0ABS9VAJ0_9BACT|nr:hypothetical protein [Belliella alkalica]MCH7413442.1 hypothetical protein [Belliella alkalica]
MDKGFIQETFQLIDKDFNLQTREQVELEDQLFELLTPILRQMLNRDFERLLQICYRIDLDEHKLKQILNESNPEQMAEELAEAIIKRQMKKIEIRRKYSQL